MINLMWLRPTISLVFHHLLLLCSAQFVCRLKSEMISSNNTEDCNAATRAVKLKCYLCAEFAAGFQLWPYIPCPAGTVVCFRPAWTGNKYVTLRYSEHDYRPIRDKQTPRAPSSVSPRNWLIPWLILWPRWPLGGGCHTLGSYILTRWVGQDKA